MAERAFQNVLRLEQQQQASVFNLFRSFTGQQTTAPPPPASSAATIEESGTPTSISLTPADISGFYKVTGPTEATFYVTTEWPNLPVGLGWTGDGFLGIRGQIQITGATNVPGPGFLWFFTFQTDTDQNVEGTQNAVGAILYPPGLIQYTNKRTKVPLFGYYDVTGGKTTFYFTARPPNNLANDWIVTGLPTIRSPMKVTSFSSDIAQEFFDPSKKKSTEESTIVHETLMTLEMIDGSIPRDTSTPVYVSGVPAMIQEPAFTNIFAPGKFTSFREAPKDLSQLPPVTMPSSISIGNYPEQRDLNSNTAWNAEATIELFPPGKYDESRGKGFSSGSILALEAIGPQEKYLLTDDLTKSQWNPEFKKYSNFVMYQKVYQFPPPSPTYQGQTVQIELRPTELGHLLSNMYLSVTLPTLPNGCSYTPNIGRALIKQIDLLVNETIVETLYDDWYVIRDQMFLDADEQLGLQQALNPPASQTLTYLGTGGDSVDISGENVIHTFLQSNTFSLSVGTYATILVVGGGGSGANGLYTSNLSSNINLNTSVAGPITFTAPVVSSLGAYVGANAYITTQGTAAFTTNIYVSAFTSTSITFRTFGTLTTWSNLLPSGNTISILNGNGGGGGGVYNKTFYLAPGNYAVTVGSGGTQATINGGISSINGQYIASGGFGGALGGASGTGFTSNASYRYLSNIVYESGGGAGGNALANSSAGSGTQIFTYADLLGSGGPGIGVTDFIAGQTAYFGGGGGGASNTSISGTLGTPGGVGGGGIGYVNNGQTITYYGITNGLSFPIGVAIGPTGNVYVADSGNNIIRNIDPTGNFVLNLGSGIFKSPYGVAVDSQSNVYVSDTGGNAVRKINSTTGLITSLGSGFEGPTGIAIDSNSNVYVASPTQGNVFVINSTTNAVSNLARPVGGWYGLNGLTIARGNVYVTNTYNVASINIQSNSLLSNLARPSVGYSNATVLATGPLSNIYVSDTYGSNVWMINVASGSTTQIITDPLPLIYPTGIAVDAGSNVFITNTGSNQVYADNSVFSILGAVSFLNPQAAVSDSSGNIYVANTYENAINKVYPTGVIISLGSGFNIPQDVCLDSQGNIYVADTGNDRILKMNPTGTSITPIGSGFLGPQSVSTDSTGNVYICDTGNHRVVEVSTSGTITTLSAPSGGWDAPTGLSLDSSGNIYVTDSGLANVFKIVKSSGSVVTLSAPSGGWNTPYSTSVDSQGNIYVADAMYGAPLVAGGIFKISGYTVTEIARGNFSGPQGVFVDVNGNIVVADTLHNSVKQINFQALSGGMGTGGGGGGGVGSANGGSGAVLISYASPQTIVPQCNITIPLEFFFCRRHSHNNKGRERLRRPYFPACAMWNQRLYVRFTFNPNTWWTNSPVAATIDLYPVTTTLWPNLITEEILLENPEKLYYMNTPLQYIVNRVQKESPQFFNSQTIQLNFTANYPVQTLAWFFRNKLYETTTNGNYYNSRYSYGYTTQYIQTGITLNFPSGQSNYVDVIDTAKITLNNIDILSTFRGSLYYSFKQPMEHSLSIPSKNIYTYSFGLTPKEYNQGGYLNFSKLNSQTTYLQITFLPQYTSQITQGYNLYLYYYGYTMLQFRGGFASLPFL